MKTLLPKLIITIAALLPLRATAAGLPPWQFGMSRSQVVSFKDFGPYKEFKNGDVETFNGRFHGRKENIQFFFQGDRLRRIGVYLWEGKDLKKGVPIFQRAYELLEKEYGKIALPEIKVAPGSEPPNSLVFAIGAGANADVTGKTEMFPVKQPRDMQVSAKFMRAFSREGKSFAVAIFFDPRP